jgi:beta-glucosidase
MIGASFRRGVARSIIEGPIVMHVRSILAALLLATAAGPVAAEAPVVFPAGFLWGAATAAHQVEGGLRNDWTAFEATPGAIAHGDTAAVAVDHYRRYDEDFALAAGMGHNAHRMSIEWARIEPQRGEWDESAIAHYHAVFASLKRHGLKPMVTLHHFTNPVWVADQGGWCAARTVEDFARFAALMGREFGSEVDTWITVNEPNVYAFQGHDAGYWPPRRKDREEALRVIAQLVKGHAAAYRALHRTDRVDADGDGRAAMVGVAQHVAIFDAFAFWSPIDHGAAIVNDRIFNRAFLAGATTGELRMEVPGLRGVRGFEPAAVSAMDFIGVNYYTRWRTQGMNDRVLTPGAPTTAIGWEIYPEGLYRALRLANDYTRLPDGRRVPLVVTENGIDDRDGTRRSAYLVRHLQQVARAIADGMDVRGYLHWTLMDNFEWAEGYAPKFGLYRVDRRPGADLRRIPTETVPVFKAITAANGLTPELLHRYGE